MVAFDDAHVPIPRIKHPSIGVVAQKNESPFMRNFPAFRLWEFRLILQELAYFPRRAKAPCAKTFQGFLDD